MNRKSRGISEKAHCSSGAGGGSNHLNVTLRRFCNRQNHLNMTLRWFGKLEESEFGQFTKSPKCSTESAQLNQIIPMFNWAGSVEHWDDLVQLSRLSWTFGWFGKLAEFRFFQFTKSPQCHIQMILSITKSPQCDIEVIWPPPSPGTTMSLLGNTPAFAVHQVWSLLPRYN